MSIVLEMIRRSRRVPSEARPPIGACEIVIFPGVRIERHDIDLGHRVQPTLDRGDFDGLGGSGRRRKSS